MARQQIVIAVLACVIQWSPAHGGTVDGAQLPEAVRDKLTARGRALSPISVSWTEQYRSTLDRETTLARLGLHRKSEEFFALSQHRVLWQDGNLYAYHQRRGTDKGGRMRNVREESFDGKVYYVGSRGAGNPKLFKRWMERLAANEPATRFDGADYFEVAGIHLPRELGDFRELTFNSELEYELKRRGQLLSVDEASNEGQTLLRVSVRTDNPLRKHALEIDLEKLKEEKKLSPDPPELQKQLLDRVLQWRLLPPNVDKTYYLDPSHDYATVRWERSYSTGKLLSRCDCSDFQKIGDRALWLPKKCDIRYYWFDTAPETYFEEPILTQSYLVTEFSTNAIPESRFVLVYHEPGTEIADGTLPESPAESDGYVRYVVPANPSDLDSVIERARSLRAPSTALGRIIFIGLNLIVLGALGVYLWKRSRPNVHSNP